MNSLLVIVSSLCALVNAVHCTEEVPVLAWGSGSEAFSVTVPAQHKLSTSEFLQDYLGQLAPEEPSAIIAFVEKSLSQEDLVSSNTDEESAYPTLQKTFESSRSVKYFPYVSNPLKALKALDYETHEVEGQSSPTLPDSAKLLFVVKLDGARDDEDRLNLLQRHDKVIHELCSKIQEKYDKAVCVLTAEQKSWMEPDPVSYSSRKLLQAAESSDLNLYYDKKVGMIFTKQPPTLLLKSTNETLNLTMPTVSSSGTKEDGVLTVSLTSPKGSVTLAFHFLLPNASWTWELQEVDVTINQKTDQLQTKSFIGASIGNSFHTPRNVTFDSDNYSLTFAGLQAQYFATEGESVFGPAEDDIYFFTIPILSGLFVTSLLITIVMIGLVMIFDIKTMDQFDDPKGKTITINASD